MRAFIAIELPDELKEELSKLKLPDANLTLVKKENMHLTLKFLGEIKDSKISEVIEKLNTIKFSPFELETSEIGFFPNENYIRVVWIGIKDDSKLIELQKQVDNTLYPLFPKEKNFSSHITIARVKFMQNKSQFVENISKINIPAHKFDIKGFKLKKSTLMQNGPLYEDIASIGL